MLQENVIVGHRGLASPLKEVSRCAHLVRDSQSDGLHDAYHGDAYQPEEPKDADDGQLADTI